MFYTRYNNQGEHSWMRVKLDRFMTNGAWFGLFSHAEVCFHEAEVSDHSPTMSSWGNWGNMTVDANGSFGFLN